MTKKDSEKFNAIWYSKTYPDVAILGMEPSEHFLKYGRAMGRPGNEVPVVSRGRSDLSAPALLTARRSAGVASTLSRLPMLAKAFNCIAQQVDELHVYLNGYEAVPDFLRGLGNVKTYLSSEYDDLGDAGKFYGLSDVSGGHFFSFDDDILYPADYASRLISVSERYGCPVGVHGSILRRDAASYYNRQGRHVLHFAGALGRDTPVDIVGTGTFCVNLDQHPLKAKFDYRNMADLWVAEYYRARNIPLLCVARDNEWLKPIQTDSKSIWDTNRDLRTAQHLIVEEKARSLAGCSRPKIGNLPRIFIGLKTYNRCDYLRQSIESIIRTLEPGYDYVLVVADDGSSDGTRDYLETLSLPVDFSVILNDRRYASGQFNDLVRAGLNRDCDYFFILDDDVVFKKSGWVSAYRNASMESGYDHLCHYNLPHHEQLSARRGNDPHPTELRSTSAPLSAYGPVTQCMGALMTLSPRVIEAVGLADETNFFVRGQWHVDFSARACRAGFNEFNRFYDLRGSNDYIELQNTIAQEYQTSISWQAEEFKLAARADEVARRKAIVQLRTRIFSPAKPDFLSHSDAVSSAVGVNDFFDRVVVLNLDRRPDRLSMISDRLDRLGIEFERHSAVDGQDPAVQQAYRIYAQSIKDFPESAIRNGPQYYQGAYSASEQARYIQVRSKSPAIRSAGAWAYLLGYRDILCRALESNWETVLILDDDCVFHKDFRVLFDAATAELPSSWRILHLGTMQYHWDITERYSKSLYMPHGSIVGSHAVGYRRAVIPALLNWIDMMNLPYDMGALQKESLRHRDVTFVTVPDLAIQDDLASDINSSDVAPKEGRLHENKFRWKLTDYDY